MGSFTNFYNDYHYPNICYIDNKMVLLFMGVFIQMIPEFQGFPKIARLSRDVIITEKIDGTNAQIFITEDNLVYAGSRTRWITPENDNFGFAKWVEENKQEVLELGAGRHFGEWWGRGIQRGYGLSERRFSLFNVTRWTPSEPQRIPMADPRIEKYQEVLPECIGLVPILYKGTFDTSIVDIALSELAANGSQAAPGFMKPEGLVVYHVAGNVGFKITIDDNAKGLQ